MRYGFDREMLSHIAAGRGPRSAPRASARSRGATTASAKPAGSSAIMASRSWTRYMPSAAIEVRTVGTPSDILWFTLPFTPAPYRIGATETRARSKIGLTSGTRAEDLDGRSREFEDLGGGVRAHHTEYRFR